MDSVKYCEWNTFGRITQTDPHKIINQWGEIDEILSYYFDFTKFAAVPKGLLLISVEGGRHWVLKVDASREL